jgi:hypothetical protein
MAVYLRNGIFRFRIFSIEYCPWVLNSNEIVQNVFNVVCKTCYFKYGPYLKIVNSTRLCLVGPWDQRVRQEVVRRVAQRRTCP